MPFVLAALSTPAAELGRRVLVRTVVVERAAGTARHAGNSPARALISTITPEGESGLDARREALHELEY